LKIACKYLKPHARFNPRFEEKRLWINAAGRTHAPQQSAFSIWMFCPIARDRFLHVGDVTDW
jgi:hypothetical protein